VTSFSSNYDHHGNDDAGGDDDDDVYNADYSVDAGTVYS